MAARAAVPVVSDDQSAELNDCRASGPGVSPGRPRRWVIAVGFALLTALASWPQAASAHPLGYFTVNQYTRLEVTARDVRVVYVLDLAEIPAFQEIEERIDAGGDGEISDDERATYLDAKLSEIRAGLHLLANGQKIDLEPQSAELTFPAAQAGLKLMHLRVVLRPVQPVAIGQEPLAIEVTNAYEPGSLGWREMLVTHGPGVAIEGVEVPAADVSDELRQYPEDMLQSPLDERRLAFTVTHRAGAAAAKSFERFVSDQGTGTGQPGIRRWGIEAGSSRFAGLVAGGDLTAGGIVAALCLALLWGAAHALSPGHGKTLVSAYLVGSRGTTKHAAFLGLTVTITHTTGVLALGLVTLFASRFVVPQDLLPWLGAGSGALVVLIGLSTLRQRLPRHHGHHDHTHHAHDHNHDDVHQNGFITHTHCGTSHSHLPPGNGGSPLTWRGLLALGISGGLVPCPSALVVLLGAVALGRAGFGLALVVAFSVGLAATLTLLGIASLYASHFIRQRRPAAGRIGPPFRYAPAAGSIALTIAGCAIIARALGELGMR